MKKFSTSYDFSTINNGLFKHYTCLKVIQKTLIYKRMCNSTILSDLNILIK